MCAPYTHTTGYVICTEYFIGADRGEEALFGVAVHQSTLTNREQPAGWPNVSTMRRECTHILLLLLHNYTMFEWQ